MRSFQLIIFALLIQLSLSSQDITWDWYGALGNKNKAQFIFQLSEGEEQSLSLDRFGRTESYVSDWILEQVERN